METQRKNNKSGKDKENDKTKSGKKKEDAEDELVFYCSELFLYLNNLTTLFALQSEEDRLKKEELELLVQRVKDTDEGVQKFALVTLSTEIKSATASMTSVPKPLKFLRPHYEELKTFFASMQPGENKVQLRP
jgi:hypothetical protein